MSRSAWFDLLPTADQRRLRDLASDDATRMPLPTPALTAWRRHGCRIGGAVWAAACWEASAVEATSESRRVGSFTMSRAIIAVAKGEVTLGARAAA